MSERLLLDFDAFFLEHRCCGDLDGGGDDERVWLACIACGARIERPAETSEDIGPAPLCSPPAVPEKLVYALADVSGLGYHDQPTGARARRTGGP